MLTPTPESALGAGGAMVRGAAGGLEILASLPGVESGNPGRIIILKLNNVLLEGGAVVSRRFRGGIVGKVLTLSTRADW